MNRTLDLLSSTLASTLRGWRGTSGSKSVRQPPEPPQLFDREGDPECRLVREALTELNLDVMLYPCPEGGERHLGRLRELSGASRIPFLFDPNTGRKLSGAGAIIEYLFEHYGQRPVPAPLRLEKRNLLASRLASLARFQAGTRARPSKPVQEPMVLYSFESSPYSRPVRERLCELEIPYRLVNLGKQQLADMGPANFRLHRGPYRPLPDTKRDAFLKRHGRVQVPFLIDPNRNVEIFESAEILSYLEHTYQA